MCRPAGKRGPANVLPHRALRQTGGTRVDIDIFLCYVAHI